MTIKEVLRDVLSYENNYELRVGQKFRIYEQLHPEKEFIIEIIKPLKVVPEVEINEKGTRCINGWNGFDYWNFTFKGYYRRLSEREQKAHYDQFIKLLEAEANEYHKKEAIKD